MSSAQVGSKMMLSISAALTSAPMGTLMVDDLALMWSGRRWIYTLILPVFSEGFSFDTRQMVVSPLPNGVLPENSFF